MTSGPTLCEIGCGMLFLLEPDMDVLGSSSPWAAETMWYGQMGEPSGVFEIAGKGL